MKDPSRKLWTSSQIQLASLSVFLLVVSLFVYLRGFACHFVTYAPTVPQDWIAEQLWKGVIHMGRGTIGVSIASGWVSFLDTKYKKALVVLIATLALVLVGGMVLIITNE